MAVERLGLRLGGRRRLDRLLGGRLFPRQPGRPAGRRGDGAGMTDGAGL